MAKAAYKIPMTLDQQYLDTQINLSTKNMTIPPMPAKIIFGFILGGLFIYWLIQSSFMAPSPWWLKLCLLLLMACMLCLLLWPDATGNSRYILVPALFDYLQKSNRVAIVRRTNPANVFMHVSGIENVMPEQGLIHFTDGSWGWAYRIVGNASLLLFHEDKDAVLERVDDFYRKMKEDYSLIYLTAKEPQHVIDQLNSLRERFAKLDNNDPDLRAVARMRYRWLHDEVGGQYRSIHQYLIIKADSPEALKVARNILNAEIMESHLMFRETEALIGNDLTDMLGSIFKGRESI